MNFPENFNYLNDAETMLITSAFILGANGYICELTFFYISLECLIFFIRCQDF